MNRCILSYLSHVLVHIINKYLKILVLRQFLACNPELTRWRYKLWRHYKWHHLLLLNFENSFPSSIDKIQEYSWMGSGTGIFFTLFMNIQERFFAFNDVINHHNLWRHPSIWPNGCSMQCPRWKLFNLAADDLIGMIMTSSLCHLREQTKNYEITRLQSYCNTVRCTWRESIKTNESHDVSGDWSRGWIWW